jgi:hypothetical protein
MREILVTGLRVISAVSAVTSCPESTVIMAVSERFNCGWKGPDIRGKLFKYRIV